MLRLALFILRQAISAGQLRITLPGHADIVIKASKSEKNGPDIGIALSDKKTLYRLIISPDPTIGELYVNGDLTITKGSFEGLIDFLFINSKGWEASLFGKLFKPFHFLYGWFSTLNPAGRSRRNVAHHYDLTDDLFDLFLDKNRQYSCAYFYQDDDTLEQAQMQKIAHLAAKLNLKDGVSILDIGCGWGGLATTLSQFSPNSHITGITLSEKQFSYFQDRIKENNQQDKLSVEFRDFRDLGTRQFDRIVSVGMLEHVGQQNFDAFFSSIEKCLASDGVAVIHAIGRFGPPRPTSSWLNKYIFPGGYLPNMTQMMRAIEKTGLKIIDVEILRMHYAQTLKLWREAFEKNKDRISTDYDEKFTRMWRFYLQTCENYFKYEYGMIFQIQLAHDQQAVPLTRHYIEQHEKTYMETLCQNSPSGKLKA